MSPQPGSGPDSPGAGRSRRRRTPWLDRTIGIVIGVVVGVAAVVLFVFVLGSGGLDAPSLDDETDRPARESTTSP